MTSKPVAAAARRPRRRPQPLPPARVATTTPTARPRSRPSSTARRSPTGSARIEDARAFCERVLRLLQPRAPPLRHRPAHPGIGPLRHRHRDPRPTRASPSTPPTPPTPTGSGTADPPAKAAHRRLDQRPLTRSTHTEQLTRRCLKVLDRFRPADRSQPERGAPENTPRTPLPAPGEKRYIGPSRGVKCLFGSERGVGA